MDTVNRSPEPEPAPCTAALTTALRRFTPLRLWAAAGVGFLLLILVILALWLADGAWRLPAVSYQIPPVRKGIVWAAQVGMAAVLLGWALVLWRTCRRERQVTLDAALLLGFFTCGWAMPLFGYHQVYWVQNQYAVKAGTWGHYLPGWDGGPASLTHQSLIALLMNPMMLIWVHCQRWTVRQITRRRPDWGTVRLLPFLLMSGVAASVAFEVPVILAGLYAYPSAPQGLSLFGGHWYQLSLLQVIATVVVVTPIVGMEHHARRRGRPLHLFQNDVPIGARTQGVLRLGAGIGLANSLILLFALLTNLSMLLFGTSPPPADLPSYLWPR
ncbi:spirocyclase AveC family protein [Streptomyces klenkii]|uniref:spirocyclase AveC family protein n=1 Tax=Streptomyces klenkii TaxID=1420899 RepID=UPI0033A367DC